MRNAQYTIKACILSVIDYVDEIIVVNNNDATSFKILKELNNSKIKIYDWPYEIVKVWTSETNNLPCDDCHSLIAMSNFALDKCSNDWCLKVDSDMVFFKTGMEAILNTNFIQPFLGVGGYECTDPFNFTYEFFGEEPRFFNKTLEGGLQFRKYFNTGGEIIWNPAWSMDTKNWGPRYSNLNKKRCWVHYGWSTSSDPQRPYRGLKQTAINFSHHRDIIPSLHKIFNQ